MDAAVWMVRNEAGRMIPARHGWLEQVQCGPRFKASPGPRLCYLVERDIRESQSRG